MHPASSITMSDYPQLAPLISSNANNFTAVASSSDYRATSGILTVQASGMNECARNKSFLFHSRIHTPAFSPLTFASTMPTLALYSRVTLSIQRHYKIIGAIFDTHCIFTLIKYISERCASRVRILEALAGARRGQDKGTLLVTYRALIHFLMLYAGLVWFPNASSSAVERLQRMQNSGLRLQLVPCKWPQSLIFTESARNALSFSLSH